MFYCTQMLQYFKVNASWDGFNTIELKEIDHKLKLYETLKHVIKHAVEESQSVVEGSFHRGDGGAIENAPGNQSFSNLRSLLIFVCRND